MSAGPIPLAFIPLFKTKPWGGRKLEELFGKPLPPGEPIGESWELVSLPGNESVVKDGPLAGRSLRELVEEWGPALLGKAPRIDGGFPLLIKFLDARENLSVQVHPKPPEDPQTWVPGVKHEAWYVLDAEPGAAMFIGLKPGVTQEEVARAANTPKIAEMLCRRPARVGDCFYLPSGVPHALGAGLVVAEVQTPSDVTYRFYDWGRVDRDGRPRALHIPEALANVRLDIPDSWVEQPPLTVSGPLGDASRVASCERFRIDRVNLPAGRSVILPPGEMIVWITLSAQGSLSTEGLSQAYRGGDVLLVPAEHDGLTVDVVRGGDVLLVTVPAGEESINRL